MTNREQRLGRVDSSVDRLDEPDVEAHRLDAVERVDKLVRIDRIDRPGEPDVEAHRLDTFEGRRDELD